MFASFISNRFQLPFNQAKEIVLAYLKMFPNKPQPTVGQFMSAGLKLEATMPAVTSKTKVKARIDENKNNGVACCPKCGSTSIQPDNGKFHLGRAIVGDTLLGSGGAVMGLTHGKKVPMICLNCGHRWKLK